MIVLSGCSSTDAASSFQTSSEVHADLTALSVEELGEEPASVTAELGECRAWFGARSNAQGLVLESSWTLDQDVANLDAAIVAAQRYLQDRDGAEALGNDADGYTYIASADSAGINVPWVAYETSGRGTPGGANITTYSTVCAQGESQS